LLNHYGLLYENYGGRDRNLAEAFCHITQLFDYLIIWLFGYLVIWLFVEGNGNFKISSEALHTNYNVVPHASQIEQVLPTVATDNAP